MTIVRSERSYTMALRKWIGSEQDLKDLHKCLLILLKEIHRICEKYDIKYFLDSGTLLGAVRHQGFIPWDDDADVGMLRADFEKFKKYCIQEMKDCFFVETKKQFRLCLKETLRIAAVNNQRAPISIDIFPYDNIPDTALLRHLYVKIGIFLTSVKKEKNNVNEAKTQKIDEFLYNIIVKITAIFLSRKVIDNFLNSFLSICKNKNTRNVSKLIGVPMSFWKNINSASLYDEVILVPFEDTKFYILKNYDVVLTNLYGDYMTPPPENVDSSKIDIEEWSYSTRIAHPIAYLDPGEWINGVNQ